MRNHTYLATLTALALAPSVLGQQLLIPESTNDAVMLFDAMDGSLINASFIDLTTSTGSAPSTPIEAKVAPNGEIFVVDQVADTVFRFSSDGTMYLGETAAALDNARGMEIAYGSVWVSNSGTGNGAPGDSLVELDLGLNLITSHPGIGDPFDAQAFVFNGTAGLLVSDLGGDNLWFFDPANPGSPAIFHDSDGATGFDFPEQVTINNSNGNPLLGGFTAPSGIYEFDKTTGAEVNYIDTGALAGLTGIRAAYTLGNGNILFTNGGGVHLYDTALGTISTVYPGVQARFISEFDGGTDGTAFCSPANVNSSGNPVQITGMLNGGSLHLEAVGGPQNEFGYFLIGTGAETASPITISDGLLCLSLSGGNTFGRYNVIGSNLNSVGNFDSGGTFNNLVGTSTVGTGFDVPTTVPITGSPSIMAGQTWHFQMWYRDSPSGVGVSNLSNGLSVTF